MPNKKFYEVKPEAYLFLQKTTDKKRNTPEEKVRQWALFELISTYGFSVNEIRIEEKAKIGSSYYYADIVAFKNNSPFIVVECKKQNGRVAVDEALKQAISYANYLGADFVVYTDGKEWVVKRKILDQWYIVSDIPSQAQNELTSSLVALLESYVEMKPILYWMNKPVPAKYSKEFLFFVHRFFCENIHSIPFSLSEGMDNLLRVVGNGKDEKVRFNPDGYEDSKLRIAYDSFVAYFEEIKFAEEIFLTKNPEIYNFEEMAQGLLYRFEGLLERQYSLEGIEFLVIRLVVAILDYLQIIIDTDRYVDIPPRLMKEIQNFVNVILITKFGVSLPDTLDRNGNYFLSVYCSERWYEHYLTIQNGEKL